MTTHYRIQLRGHVDQTWSTWFENLAISHQPDGTTTLEGPLVDQAALYGVLDRARDLGLMLLGVAQIEPRHPDSAESGCINRSISSGLPS
jgi:hypothetical protein